MITGRFTPHDRCEDYTVQTKAGKRIAFSEAATELLGITPAQAASLFWPLNSLQEVIDIAAKIKVDAAAQ